MKKIAVLILSLSLTGATLLAQEPVTKNKAKNKTECVKDDKTCCKPGTLRAKKKATDNQVAVAKKPEIQSAIKQN